MTVLAMLITMYIIKALKSKGGSHKLNSLLPPSNNAEMPN
jgi:hypothetical protein